VSPRNRSNPLALAVLICLAERPMHPYEAATTLRQRGKQFSVRLNYGSLYAVVESLERRGLIEAIGAQREGRLPERTVYRVTQPGLVEAHDWLSDLLSTPAKEYPAFEAALSFLPALPPEHAATLLEERAGRLELEIAQAQAIREMVQKHGLPRLFWVEAEFAGTLKVAELGYVRKLARDIRAGTLEGADWWTTVHQGGEAVVPYSWEWPVTEGPTNVGPMADGPMTERPMTEGDGI
jgi:DNA-binding PadR family transcriptional regulator